MERLIAFVGLLEALGGSVSVLFIVLLALAMAGLAVVYVAAAVVVLDRFARAATRPRWMALSGCLLAAGGAALLIDLQRPELADGTWGDWLPAWSLRFAAMSAACLVAMGLCRALMRALPPETLARAVAYAFASALALLAAVGGSPAASLAVAAGLVGVGTVIWLRRRRRAEPKPSQALRVTRGLVVLALLAALGSALGIESSAAIGPSGLLLLQLLVALLLLGLLPLALAGLLEVRGRAEWFIATRYLVAERRQIFLSVITLICVGGVASGVWLIIVVLSVMNGFEQTWRDEIVGNYAHVLVRSYSGRVVGYEAVAERIAAVDGVVAQSPFIEGEGMLRGGGGRIEPVRLRGVDPRSATQVTRIDEKIRAGSLEALAEADPNGHPPIILGSVLAEKLGLAVGDSVILIAPFGGPQTPMGPAPRLMRAKIVGLFQSSFMQYDELYAYTNLAGAQTFAGVRDVVDGFEVRTHDFFRSRQVAWALEEELGYPFFARDWKELFPQFFRALQDNRSLMFLLLIMIMVVAAFIIVVTLMMMIMAKSSDIGILKAMGAADESIERIFAIEGTLIGLVGVALGIAAGIAVTKQLPFIQNVIERVTGVDTLPVSVYQVGTLPSHVDPLQVVGVATIALILALGATLLPSRHGAQLDPVEALRQD